MATMEKEFAPYQALWNQIAQEVAGEMKLNAAQKKEVLSAAAELFGEIRENYENYTEEPIEGRIFEWISSLLHEVKANKQLEQKVQELEHQLQDLVQDVTKHRDEVAKLAEDRKPAPRIEIPSLAVPDSSSSPSSLPPKTQKILSNLTQNLSESAELLTKLKSDVPATTQKAKRIKEVQK